MFVPAEPTTSPVQLCTSNAPQPALFSSFASAPSATIHVVPPRDASPLPPPLDPPAFSASKPSVVPNASIPAGASLPRPISTFVSAPVVSHACKPNAPHGSQCLPRRAPRLAPSTLLTSSPLPSHRVRTYFVCPYTSIPVPVCSEPPVLLPSQPITTTPTPPVSRMEFSSPGDMSYHRTARPRTPRQAENI
jgi:hypothetical protein